VGKDAQRIQELVDGLKAMDAFFTFVDGLKAKKLGVDGENALTVIVSVVELLLPMHARLAYAAPSDGEGKKAAKPRKRSAKKRKR
jgi:hypothetical protein